MFETSLIESTPALRSHNRWPATASILIQGAVAATIVLVPLLHPELVALHTAPPTLFAPPPTRPVQPLPRIRIEPTVSRAQALPSYAPNTAAQTSAHPMTVAPDTSAVSLFPATLGTMPTAASTLATLATGDRATTVSVAPVAANHSPLPLSRGVSAGLLLGPIQPVYPAIAKVTHTQGTVIVHAIISREGRIESAQVVSGPAMLQASAIEAVRAARYKPYLLNGSPTEVDTTFSINFHIDQ